MKPVPIPGYHMNMSLQINSLVCEVGGGGGGGLRLSTMYRGTHNSAFGIQN